MDLYFNKIKVYFLFAALFMVMSSFQALGQALEFDVELESLDAEAENHSQYVLDFDFNLPTDSEHTEEHLINLKAQSVQDYEVQYYDFEIISHEKILSGLGIEEDPILKLDSFQSEVDAMTFVGNLKTAKKRVVFENRDAIYDDGSFLFPSENFDDINKQSKEKAQIIAQKILEKYSEEVYTVFPVIVSALTSDAQNDLMRELGVDANNSHGFFYLNGGFQIRYTVLRKKSLISEEEYFEKFNLNFSRKNSNDFVKDNHRALMWSNSSNGVFYSADFDKYENKIYRFSNAWHSRKKYRGYSGHRQPWTNIDLLRLVFPENYEKFYIRNGFHSTYDASLSFPNVRLARVVSGTLNFAVFRASTKILNSSFISGRIIEDKEVQEALERHLKVLQSILFKGEDRDEENVTRLNRFLRYQKIESIVVKIHSLPLPSHDFEEGIQNKIEIVNESELSGNNSILGKSFILHYYFYDDFNGQKSEKSGRELSPLDALEELLQKFEVQQKKEAHIEKWPLEIEKLFQIPQQKEP